MTGQSSDDDASEEEDEALWSDILKNQKPKQQQKKANPQKRQAFSTQNLLEAMDSSRLKWVAEGRIFKKVLDG